MMRVNETEYSVTLSIDAIVLQYKYTPETKKKSNDDTTLHRERIKIETSILFTMVISKYESRFFPRFDFFYLVPSCVHNTISYFYVLKLFSYSFRIKKGSHRHVIFRFFVSFFICF